MNFAELLNLFWYLIQFLIGYNLIIPIVSLFIYLLVSKTTRTENIPTILKEADYAIIVTAYEQTELLKGVVDSILGLNYSNYMIYIVADNCDISELNFDSDKVILLRPEKVLSSNTGSHFYAINRFVREHERLTIIDSDNLVHKEYLNELNPYFDHGFLAVQGLRDAKNLNTLYANLDAARDIYYHFYDGEVLFHIGSSATLSGSGMAFTTALYKDCLEHLNITGAGFDKILQKQIVLKNQRIAFAKRAIVYDEKTSRTDQLVKQRARWINTWFKYFSFGFKLLFKGIAGFNWNQFLFGVILIRPPLFILLLLSLAFTFINVILGSPIWIIWAISFFLFVLGFFSALLINNAKSSIYKSLWGIPTFVFYQVISLFRAKNANKHSVATKHFTQS